MSTRGQTMRTLRRLAIAALLGAGCAASPAGVQLSIDGTSLPPADRVQIARLDFTFTEAKQAPFDTSRPVTDRFDRGTERVLYVPSAAATGTLSIAVAAWTGDNVLLATGSSMVELTGPHVDALVMLSAVTEPLPDLGAPDLGVPDLSLLDAAVPDLAAKDQSAGPVDLAIDDGAGGITVGGISYTGPGPVLGDSSNVLAVSNDVYISDPQGETKIDLRHVRSIGGHLYVTGGTTLATIDLRSLETVGGYVYFDGCNALTAIDMPRLKSVGGYFYVGVNPALSLLSTPSLTSVGGLIYISGNPQLCVPPVPSWSTITTQAVTLTGNKSSCP